MDIQRAVRLHSQQIYEFQHPELEVVLHQDLPVNHVSLLSNELY
jgi:hypothetical protein